MRMCRDADVTAGNLRMSMRIHIHILPVSWTAVEKRRVRGDLIEVF